MAEITGHKKQILIVDDSPALFEVLPRMSKNLPYEYFEATSVDKAITSMTAARPSIAVIDYNINGDGNGVQVVKAAQEMGIPVIMVSGTEGVSENAKELGVPFVHKRLGVVPLLKEIASQLDNIPTQKPALGRSR